MQALGLRRIACSARSYSTRPILPDGALAARTASAPLAVRLRRRKKFGPLQEGQTDADASGLTPTEVARYNRLKALGEIPLDGEGKPITSLEWIQKVNERRSRIRGLKLEKQKDGSELVKVLGQRVYLPNIEFKLVRNHTPAGKPYNPYEATFRIPKSVTKTDIRSYLNAVYGVRTSYVRTDNYYAPEESNPQKAKAAHRSYKRAVVGLAEPFYYPHRLEDMTPEQKKEREDWLEKEFNIEAMNQLRREETLRQAIGHGSASFRYKPENATRRSHILKLVTDRKIQRETMVSGVVQKIKERREQGEDVTYRGLSAETKPASTTEESKS